MRPAPRTTTITSADVWMARVQEASNRDASSRTSSSPPRELDASMGHAYPSPPLQYANPVAATASPANGGGVAGPLSPQKQRHDLEIPSPYISTLPTRLARNQRAGRADTHSARDGEAASRPSISTPLACSSSAESYMFPNPVLRAKPAAIARITGKAARIVDGYTPRPPNAWILYRSQQIRNLKQDPDLTKKPQSDISKIIGAMWRGESTEVRGWYELQAEVKKAEHKEMYPDYRFSPARKEKVGVDTTTVVLPNPSTATRSEAKVVRHVASRTLDSASRKKMTTSFPSKPSPPRRTASFETSPRRPGAESEPFLPNDLYPSSNYEEIEALKSSPHDLDHFVMAFTESYLEPHAVLGGAPAASLDAWRSFEASSPHWFPAPLSAPAAMTHFSFDHPETFEHLQRYPDAYYAEPDESTPSSTLSSSEYPSPPYIFESLPPGGCGGETDSFEYFLSPVHPHHLPMIATPEFAYAFPSR